MKQVPCQKRRKTMRGSYARITRDPAIALSYEHNARLAQEMDQGFRRLFAESATRNLFSKNL